MTNQKFYTKKGILNQDALACGYTEKSKNYDYNFLKGLPYLRLEKGLNCFHVKGRPFKNNKDSVWWCFDSYSNAADKFIEILKNNELEHHINK